MSSIRLHSLALAVSSAALLCAVMAACTSSTSQDAPPDAQWAIVQNRVWIERIPRGERDMVHQLAFVHDDDAGDFGFLAHGSRFRLFLDMVGWQRRGGELRVRVEQTKQEVTATFQAWRCAGKVPAPFELCMELRFGDKARRYFSREDWIIDSIGSADAQARAYLRTLPFQPGDGGDDGSAADVDAPEGWLPTAR